MSKPVPTWIQTYTGAAFNLADPRPEDVRREDIAHALGRLPRYVGHCRRHYSVAEHSVLIARWLARQTPRVNYDWTVQLGGLLHDAHEAYVGDMSAPMKQALGPEAMEPLNALERVVRLAITVHFGTSVGCQLRPQVKDADLRILHDESAMLFGPKPKPWNIPGEPLGVRIRCWSPEQARDEWLEALDTLLSGASL